MTSPPAAADPLESVSGQTHLRELTRTFLTRLYDNELTGGSTDLRTSYFWLLAFLAAPSALLPIAMSGNWDLYAMLHGTDALRIAARGSKTFAIGFGMVAIGLVSALTWNSLVLERQDALVLGALPVRPQTIVRAKLNAIALYVGMTALALHGISSLLYGWLLSTHNSVSFAVVGVIAHLLACMTASAFIFFAATAVQGVVFATFGPRAFGRLSPVLHVLLVSVVLMGLLWLPLISARVVDTIMPGGRHPAPGILRAPPVWYLGIYESLLGTREPIIRRLAIGAVSSLCAALLVTALTYPIAYRRLVATVVGAPAAARQRWSAGAIDWLGRAVSRDAATQAGFTFFVLSLMRVPALRFVLSIGGGVALTWAGAVALEWSADVEGWPSSPTAGLMSLPFAAMTSLLAALRIATSIPADARALWVFELFDAPVDRLRAGTWRAMWCLGVAPVVGLAAVASSYLWSAGTAVRVAVLLGAVGTLLIELLLWSSTGMACARIWRPERAKLRAWWPLYLFVYLLFTSGIATLAGLAIPSIVWTAALTAGSLLLALGLRVSHHRRTIVPDDRLDEPASSEVLNLS
jgi:hypothetical protein